MQETVELRDDGTIRVAFGETEYRLRRPKIGEFRRLKEQAREIDQRRQAWLAETNGHDAGEGPGLTDADAAETSAETERLRDRLTADYLIWHRAIFEALADKPLPEVDDDLPLWMTNPEMGREFVAHWQGVPLARGGKGPR